jgi:hypothetical protein
MDTCIGLTSLAKDALEPNKNNPSNSILHDQFTDIIILTDFETTGFQQTY